MTKRRVIIIVSGVLIVLVAVLTAWFIAYSFFSGNSHNKSNQPVSTSPDPAPKDMLACVKSLPDSVKIGQKLMVAGYSDQLGAETPVLVDMKIGGVIVMDAVTATQIGELRKAMEIAPFVAVDQEGGTVQRYTAQGVLPGADEMASQFSTEQAYDKYLADSKYLKGLGITTNFSPVVDVMSGVQNPLPGRMYSTDPNVVAGYAAASVRAAYDAGITPVIKHFPGLGSASGNTDFGSATTDPFSVLQTRDLVPYKKLAAQHPDVMVSNAIVPGLTNGDPVVWSPDAIKLLRDMGYKKAIVYSDSLTAQAVPGALDTAVVKAWQAGVDVALIVQTREQTPQLNVQLTTIIKSATEALKSGTLNNDEFSVSVARLFERKGIDACQL